ncbi:hypothetical protein D3C71_1209180 [compost metagenome]
MARNGDLAGQLLAGQRLDRAAGGAVVGRDDGLDIVAVGIERILDDRLGLGGLPFRCPLLADNGDVSLVGQRLQHVHLAFAKQARVVVGGRAAQQVVAAPGHGIDQTLGLHLADFDVVKGHIAVHRGTQDQAVIGDNLDAVVMRLGDHAAQDFRVERNNDQCVDAFGDQVLDLRDLPRFIGVGGLHMDRGAQGVGGLHEVIAVTGPALDTQIIDGEADHGGFLAGMRGGGGDQGSGQRQDANQQAAEVGGHVCLLVARCAQKVIPVFRPTMNASWLLDAPPGCLMYCRLGRR